MKLVKKVKTEIKKVQNREEIVKGKEKLNSIFKSLKSISKSIVGSAARNPSKQAAAPRDKNLKNGAKAGAPRNLTRLEEYSTVSVAGGPRKRTSDNLPIYTPEELKLGQGGDTELCPFDCDCCY